MTKTNLLISAAVAGLMTATVAAAANAADEAPVGGKCYGIAKAGQNACASASGSHSCKGQAKTDKDPGDFVMEDAAACEKDGGKTTAPEAK